LRAGALFSRAQSTKQALSVAFSGVQIDSSITMPRDVHAVLVIRICRKLEAVFSRPHFLCLINMQLT
jgi:hypothetical protein